MSEHKTLASIQATPEERERYARLAQEYARECASVEPEHAALERSAFKDWLAAGSILLHADRVTSQRVAVHAMLLERWHEWWLTRPNYDGGPQRAPSGVRLRETEMSDLRGSTLVRSGSAWVVDDDARGRAVLLQHLASLARAGAVIERRFSGQRDRDEMALLAGAIERRGWCPMLAR